MASTFPFPFGGHESGGGGNGQEERLEASGGASAHYTTSSNCDVCQRILKSTNDVKTLPCLHNFCLSCTPTQGNYCPLCSGAPVLRSGHSAAVSRPSGQVSSPQFASTSSYLPDSGAHRHLTNPLSIDTSFFIGNLIEAAALRQETTASPSAQVTTLRSDVFGPMGPFPTSVDLPRPISSSANTFPQGGSQQRQPQFNLPEFSQAAIGPHPQRSRFDTRATICQSCSEGVAAFSKCEDCQESLCQNCVQAHYRVRMTRDHRVIPLSVLESAVLVPGTTNNSGGHSPMSPPSTTSSTNEACCVHQELLLIWCETCSRSLCHLCLVDHSGHNFQYLKGNGRTLVGQLYSDARQIQRNMEETAEAVDRMGERVEARVLSVSNEVRAVLHHHISALEERKRDLLQRVDTVRVAKIQTLEQQRRDLRESLSSLKSCLDKVDLCLKDKEYTESEHGVRKVQDTLLQVLNSNKPYLAPQETDNISFIAPDPALLSAIRNLGIVQTAAHASKSVIMGENFRRIVRDRPAYFTVQGRDAMGEPCVGGGDPISVAIETPSPEVLCVADVQDRQNGTYLISYRPTVDGAHRVHVSIRGRPISGSPFTIQVRKGRDYGAIGPAPLFSFCSEGANDGQLCRPWGIACDKEGRIIVVDRSNNRVQIFDRDGNFLMKFGSPGCRPGQFDRPAGVTVNSKNHLLVADKDNHRIQVFRPDGTFEYKFGEKGRGVGQFNYPWDLAVNSEDQIAVTDTRNHRVQLFSSTGVFLRKFGFDNSLFYKHFDSPRGVSFMPDGSLLATDFNNHRLVVISMVTGDMKFYGREGELDGCFKRPQGLDVDLEGHVIVADSRNNRVQVLGPDLRHMTSFGLDQARDRPPLMDRPCDLCLGPDGRIYVVDFGNNKIRVF